MNEAAKKLTTYMSELSECAFCAGWHSGLEFDLWDMVINGPQRYGILELTSDHIQRLLEMSRECAGWIYWDEETEETFIPLEKWLEMYDRNRH